MKKLLTLTVGLVLCASIASAHGVNLSYGDCAANGAAHSVTLACTNTTAPFDMIGSVELSGPVSGFVAAAAIIDYQTAGTAVPNWWRFDGVGCRSGYATTAYNSTSGGACTAVWYPAIQGGLSTLPVEQWQLGVGGANRLRYNGVCAINGAIELPALDPLNGINEWGIIRINTTFNKTAGLGACTGCATGVCVVLNEIDLSYGAGGASKAVITSPGTGGQFVAFNTGGPTCPDATPAHNQTWGSLKSLYR